MLFKIILNNINLLQLILNTIFLFFISLGDIRERKISNKMIIPFYILNFFCLVFNFDLDNVVVEIICLLFVIFFLLIIYIKTNKIGAGDIKLFSGILIGYYFPNSIIICLIAVFLALFYNVFNRSVNKNFPKKIPLAPFVFVTYLIILVFHIINKLIIVN